MSLKELIEAAIPHTRHSGRYAVACAHPFDPEDLPIQQVEDAAQEWFVIFYGSMRSLGRKPKSMIIAVSQGQVVANCTLRLPNDMEAMSLREDLIGLMCEHTNTSVLPLDQI